MVQAFVFASCEAYLPVQLPVQLLMEPACCAVQLPVKPVHFFRLFQQPANNSSMVPLVWQPSGGGATYGTSGAIADFSCGAMVLSEHFRGSSLQQHVEIPKPQSPNSRLEYI